MTYVIAQICGVLASACSLGPLLKKKQQMLAVSLLANVLVAVNLMLLDKFGSAVFLNFAAVLQILLSMWHVAKEKPVKPAENIVFMIIFIGCGIFGFKEALDILPLIGAILFVIAIFERDEQKTRLISIGNALIYMIYYLLVGSTSALAQAISVTINSVALYAYRKKA